MDLLLRGFFMTADTDTAKYERLVKERISKRQSRRQFVSWDIIRHDE